ncbi:unnamed protein product, partial [Citrullus colocynthis]
PRKNTTVVAPTVLSLGRIVTNAAWIRRMHFVPDHSSADFLPLHRSLPFAHGRVSSVNQPLTP